MPMFLVCLAFFLSLWTSAPAGAVEAASFVGSQACAACHPKPFADWSASHHAAAMQIASEKTVRGDFDNAVFRQGDVETRFFRRNGGFFVHTPGPDGKPGDFEIKYTFGVAPLQQYLIEQPGGRLQAFGVAWDTRPKAEGGQKWFALAPDAPPPGDPLHWTGLDQTANFQCIFCHVTDFRKNYDPATKSYASAWVELGVGCEACHGPAARHLAWAQAKTPGDDQKGFGWRLAPHDASVWTANPQATASRTEPLASRQEFLMCAGCHARRAQFSDDPEKIARFHDAFHPSTLAPGVYHPDGQQRAEDYAFGSFAQSKMFSAGVTCSDCHEPHSGTLRLPGDAVCGQCHAPKIFASPTHSHHQPDSPGARCAACHMPTTDYMVVHARPDHSIRIPRPDRSVTLGVPNACDSCHADKGAVWAAAALKNWGMDKNPGAQNFAEAFAAADKGAGRSADLIAIARDDGQSAIARASALGRLAEEPSPESIVAAIELTGAEDPLIRLEAVDLLSGVAPASRVAPLAPLLSDPSAVVRRAAARALAGPSEPYVPAERRAAFDAALAEYVAGENFNADRPESRANLGALALSRGDVAGAENFYRAALELDPSFSPAALALADILRGRGDEAGAEAQLRQALAASPRAAPLYFALGLSQVRQGHKAEALESLRRAAELAPEDAHFAYVYGVALHGAGQGGEARKILTEALAKRPSDREILLALASYAAERGDNAEALGYVETLQQLEPTNRRYGAFAAALKARLNGAPP